ncbi:MAG TPA: hypothetical protein PLZ93_12320 [Nocardioides sp.]|uniref:hypothetical protein n=1 Tax=uncultured Nocardioides sp. TaxID=198441 RepID=UPI000EB9E33C|nr:hypothetical protein [uncultured Nocardioides sp.]HCB04837.1 hypothetical protein [Nocardioides sp.]HRD62306.1 hypothetical protein [Nocardioides sp.]HRI96395.1 hypothetical protein [Nocardioides sp.]HRK46163.1 hypothetical protein [Nocardioides sp.]
MAAIATAPAPSATYEIDLEGEPSADLVARFAPCRVARRPAQTLLVSADASQDDLAELLQRVLAVGLPLEEVHRPALPGYVVRVYGELDDALLRYLRWPHVRLPEQAALLLDGPPARLHAVLRDCCRLGVGIERVRRVSHTSAAGPKA